MLSSTSCFSTLQYSHNRAQWVNFWTDITGNAVNFLAAVAVALVHFLAGITTADSILGSTLLGLFATSGQLLNPAPMGTVGQLLFSTCGT